MIGRINHIAIAVPDVTAAAQHWQTLLAATVSAVQTLPEHGVPLVCMDTRTRADIGRLTVENIL